MERILDIGDLPDDRVEYLKNLIALWKKQDYQHQEAAGDAAQGSDLDKDIVFATHKSHVIGGISRATAYEDA